MKFDKKSAKKTGWRSIHLYILCKIQTLGQKIAKNKIQKAPFGTAKLKKRYFFFWIQNPQISTPHLHRRLVAAAALFDKPKWLRERWHAMAIATKTRTDHWKIIMIIATNSSQLVGGFSPFEKYESNWIISPG